METMVKESEKLRQGWQETTLGEACELIMGQSPPSTAYNGTGGGLPFFQGKTEFGDLHPVAVKWCTEPNKIAEPGDVLLSVRAPVGPTNLADQQCCIGRGLSAVRPQNGTLSKYVLYYLRSIESSIDALGAGTTFKAVSGKVLRDLPFPLAPLPEQRRIVTAIETQLGRLDAAVARLHAAKTKLKRYKQAVLKAAVEGTLTEEWREKNPGVESAELIVEQLQARRAAAEKTGRKTKTSTPAELDLDNLPSLPDGWMWSTLPQLGELNRGKSKHRPRDDKRLYGGPYPFVQTGDVRYANGLLTEYTATYSEFGLAQSRLWPAGTLCITIAANIADTAVLEFDACFPDSVVGFIPEENSIDVRFAELFIRTVKQDIERYAPATAQKNINLEVLRDVAIALPPRAEQQEIMRIAGNVLSTTDAMEATLDAQLFESTRLRQAVLRRAFEGRLVAAETPVIQMPAPLSIAAEPTAVYAKKSAAATNRDRHFARMLLSAEVVHQMHNEPEFNDVKHQKVFQLCEYIAQIPEIEGEYKRWRAGAFDNRLFHTNLGELKKQKWYGKSGGRYVPLAKAGMHAKYLSRWSDRLSVIQQILDLLKGKTADQCEIFATAYFAWNDLILWGREATEDAVFDQVWNHWHESKRRFTEERWRTAIRWIKGRGYEPTGFGKTTQQPT